MGLFSIFKSEKKDPNALPTAKVIYTIPQTGTETWECKKEPPKDLGITEQDWYVIFSELDKILREETKPVRAAAKSFRWRMCGSITGVMLGFLLGFLLTFLGFANGETGMGVVGIVFIVIFIVSIVFMVITATQAEALDNAWRTQMTDAAVAYMPKANEQARGQCTFEVVNVEMRKFTVRATRALGQSSAPHYQQANPAPQVPQVPQQPPSNYQGDPYKPAPMIIIQQEAVQPVVVGATVEQPANQGEDGGPPKEEP